MSKLYDGAMMFIMALFVFGVVVALGGVTPELLAPSFFLGLILSALWAARFVLRPAAGWKTSPMHWPVAAFAGYAIARYFTSPIEYEGRLEVFQVVLCALVYLVASQHFREPGHRRAVLWVLVGLAILESMFGLWQAVTRSDAIFHWLRPETYRGRGSGTFVCPNHLAGCLELILGLLVARLAVVRAEAATVERSMLVKVVLAYAVVVSVAGIAFTQSRAGWLAAVSGLLVIAVWRRRFSVRWLVSLGVIGVVLLGAAAFVLSQEGGWKRLTGTFERGKDGELRLADQSLGGRAYMWRGTLELIRENPVFGTGPGTWQWFYQQRKDPSLQAHPEHTHNDYLNLASDYGLVGVALVIWFFIAFFRQAAAATLPSRPDEHRAFALGAVSAVVAILVHSLVDFNLHIPGIAVLLALICGSVAGLEGAAGRFAAVPAGAWRWGLGGIVIAVVGVAGWAFVPTVASAHYADVGNGFRRRFEYDAAAHYFRLAIAADLKAPQPQISLGETYLVQAALRLGPEKEASRRELALLAAEAFEHAVRLNPYLSAGWIGRGRAYEMARDDARVLESYERARQVDPVNPTIYFRLGCFYRDRGDVARAEVEFEKSHQLRSHQDNAAGLNLYDFKTRQE